MLALRSARELDSRFPEITARDLGRLFVQLFQEFHIALRRIVEVQLAEERGLLTNDLPGAVFEAFDHILLQETTYLESLPTEKKAFLATYMLTTGMLDELLAFDYMLCRIGEVLGD